MRDVYILSAVRTPIGSFGGKLANFSAAELGAIVIRQACRQANITDEKVDEVILGCVLQAGQGQNVARQAALKAGLSIETPAVTVNKVCGSGLKAVIMAAQSIMTGDAELVVAGGAESMSGSPFALLKARFGYRMGTGQVEDVMVKDGLWCAIKDYHMGITAENVAEQWGISREEQDAFACASQNKTEKALAEKRFVQETVPVKVKVKDEVVEFAVDEFPRQDTTPEKLAKLKPAFKEKGTVTAGNASGINDGAAAVVLGTAEMAEKLGIKPLARFVAGASAGVDPSVMGIGPISATKKTLEKAGWNLSDLQLVEANEAFAAQSLAVIKELGLNPDIVNVNGGAIALGHPIGASGARILVSLLYAMADRDLQRGLATMCIGGGQGIAVLVER